MYKLYNYLFGWDYIYWSNSSDQGIARVHKNQDGIIFYWRYKNINLMDMITKKDQVIWLTCSAEKYLKHE